MREMVKRLDRSGLEWPLAADLDNAQLEAKLYGAAGVKPGRRRLPAPDWAAVHRELKRKHVTLQTLWEEYIEAHPDGYRYSRYCDLYRGWEGRLPRSEEHTSELQSLMRTSYAVFCLKKKKIT